MSAKIIYRDVSPGAAEGASYASNDAISNSTLDLNNSPTGAKYYSLETNNWILSGDYISLDNNSVQFWSSQISGDDGVFVNPPVIDITFDDQYTSVGINLIFDSPDGCFANSVTINWYQNGAVKQSGTYYPDSPDYVIAQQVVAFDRITITFASTSLPIRRLRLGQIIFGITRIFGDDEIISVDIVQETSLLGDSTPISEVNAEIDSQQDIDFLFQRKQGLEVYNNNNLIGVYYIDEHTRNGANRYSINASNAIGVLDEQFFDGLDALSGISAKTMVSNVIGDVFDITYDASVTDTTLYGILERQTKRDALSQIAIAWGVCVSTTSQGDIYIFAPDTTGTTISDDNVYMGTQVDVSDVVTSVNVTAHTYTQDDNGSIEVLGNHYSDTQTVYTVSNPDLTPTDKDNVKEITSATLISTNNAQSVAQRVYNYYLKRNAIKADIIWDGQTLGDYITIPVGWGTYSGNIQKMEIKLSNVVVASCECIGGS